MGIKYNIETMQYRTAFENLTATSVKDCFLNDKLIVIVNEGELGKAVGKNGRNIKRLENILKKKIRIIEFSSNIINFVKNLIYPVRARNITMENDAITIEVDSAMDRGKLIGRESKNLDFMKDLINKYFKVNNVKIV